jgi:hypothetical protein
MGKGILKYITIMWRILPFRFFVMPIQNGAHLIGPASRSLYPDLPPALNLPGVDASSELRLRLSDAFSSLHMLERHAIVKSYLKQKSYWDYQDGLKYDKARLLYATDDLSPYRDLRYSFQSVHRGWELRRKLKIGKNFNREQPHFLNL